MSPNIEKYCKQILLTYLIKTIVELSSIKDFKLCWNCKLKIKFHFKQKYKRKVFSSCTFGGQVQVQFQIHFKFFLIFVSAKLMYFFNFPCRELHQCNTAWQTCIPNKKAISSDKLKMTYIKCFELNPFSTNAPFMDKPGSWFLLVKCLKNTCGRVTF